MDSKLQIRRYILENYLFTDDDNELGDTDSLMERGIIDSTGVLELVSFIEETFGIKIGEDELLPGNLDSVNQLVTFLQSKQTVSSQE